MENLRTLRKSANLTQEALAELLDIDQATVSKWETGESMPRGGLYKKLAKIFNCSVDKLFGIEE